MSLENNHLGPSFLESIAKTIKANKQLKLIDLEGNDLTGGNDESGIYDLFEALKTNDTLLSLNLNNTCLTENSGQIILEALMENHHLINLDIEMNPNLRLEDVREIQSKLMENHQRYKDVRTREWKQRKQMIYEEKNTKAIKTRYDEELKDIKEIIKNAQELQLKREELYLQSVAR